MAFSMSTIYGMYDQASIEEPEERILDIYDGVEMEELER